MQKCDCFSDHEDFLLGSLAHYIKQKTNGYEPLPPFPENPPPGDVRNVEIEPIFEENITNKKEVGLLFIQCSFTFLVFLQYHCHNSGQI